MIALKILLCVFLWLAAGIGIVTITVRVWSRLHPDHFHTHYAYEKNEHVFLFTSAAILWPVSLLGLAGWGIWAVGERLFRLLFDKALSHDS